MPTLETFMLRTDEYLRTGEFLRSPNNKYFVIMQADGNLVVYKGTGPSDNRGFVWSSNVTASGGEFFAIMQRDANLVIYEGTGPSDNRGVIWSSGVIAPGNEFFAIMQGDGNLVVYKGTGPSDNRGYVWASLVAPVSMLSVNIDDFGAIGDGKTNNYNAIMAAIEFASTYNIGLIIISGGIYAVGSSLPLPNGIYFKGNGLDRTILKTLDEGDFPVFKEIRTASNPVRAGVSDMNIIGGGKNNKNAHGIMTEYSNRSRFENLSFRNCRHALDISHAWQMFCTNITVEGQGTDQNYIGWYMHETDLEHIDNAVQAVNCYVQDAEKYGFRLINFQGSKFVNCEAGGSMECGWYLGEPAKGNNKISWGHFSNCLADSTTSDGWRIIKGKAVDLKEIQFSNCWSGNTRGHGVHIQGADGIVLSNWLIIEPHKCGIHLENSNRVAITSCSIREFNKSGGGYVGINILNSNQNIISNNHCYSNQNGGGGGRGVHENGNSNFNIVTANNLSGSLKRGENSIFANNIG